jgi:L,D-transpeptidase YcbB
MRMLKRFGRALGILTTVSMLSLTVQLSIASVSKAESAEGQQAFGKKKRNTAPKNVISNSGAAGNAAIGKVTTETEVVADKNIAPMLSQDSASRLEAAAGRYTEIIANGGFPKVPKGTYKKGSEGPNVASLNKRLFVDGYLRPEAVEGEFASRVTSATIDGITRFQRNMGLAASGKMDGPTLAALNVPATERLRTIQANISRLQVYGEGLGDRYLVVNVPSQQIETVSNGKVFSRHNAIVGRVERPTPVVMTSLADVNFNPYWNAPASIVEKDLIPKMASGTQILRDMNIKVFQGFGGPEIDPDTVNWGSVNPDDYHFRQEPGPASAMATAKINFPSPFGIYLHDTPDKQLFNSGQRFYSSGCVRVDKMGLLLEWVLNGQDGIGSSEILALSETLERRDVKLAVPPQLRVSYLTAWPVGNSVAFRNDIYGLDGTGFTVGQPLPQGEVSEDGQRFVLKPVPRKAGAVDADEAESFSLFGSRKGKGTKPKTKSLYGNTDDVSDAGVGDAPPPKKIPFTIKKPAAGATVAAGKEKPVKKPGVKNPDAPGLFDWAAYRKEQKVGTKKKTVTAEKPAKKKAVEKTVKNDVAAAEPKKPIADAKLAKKPVVDAKLAKKPAVEDPKALKTPDKKVAATDPKQIKKPGTDPAKTPVEAVKKTADACKADAAGALPKGCKAPVVKKIPPKPVAAAN